jgi:survival-of-motor-neuron-related-splicing factor 30
MSDATDLENYTYQVCPFVTRRDAAEHRRVQLSQVKEALKKDPANSELVSLQGELENLIDLTRQLIGAPAPSASTSAGPSTSASTSAKGKAPARERRPLPSAPELLEDGTERGQLKAGDDCMARWSKDGKFYPAKVTTVGGSAAQPVFGVRFAADGTTELVSAADVKPMTESKKRALEAEKATLDVEKERKKRKAEKKEATKQERDADMRGKQSSWQNFAKKGAKKGGSSFALLLPASLPIVYTGLPIPFYSLAMMLT